MGREPFFTILTASLNNGATISATLESVKGQTFQDLEHIVIDGKSKDHTLEVLRDFAGTYNLFWISECDEGVADALNKGVKGSHGRYILVIQADDRLLASDTLERVYLLLRDERFDIHSFPVIKDFPGSGRQLKRPLPLLWWNHFKFIFPHQGVFVHRRVFETVGGFSNDYSIEFDYDFVYRALKASCTVKFQRTPCVALMGGSGVSSDLKYLAKRIREEGLVQKLNEKNYFWRLSQIIFRALYLPYKTVLFPRLKVGAHSRKL
jgi:GT2 family glycosyltransferase